MLSFFTDADNIEIFFMLCAILLVAVGSVAVTMGVGHYIRRRNKPNAGK